MDDIERTLYERGVAVVRGRSLTPAALVEMASRFGEPIEHPFSPVSVPGYPQITVLSNIIDQDGNQLGADRVGHFWHSDMSFFRRPASVSCLYGVECPPDGGDTLVADTAAAYDALPEGMKRELAGRCAAHDYAFYRRSRPDLPELSPELAKRYPPMEHPLVRTHPVTGRKSLFLTERGISHVAGMAETEGRELVEELVRFATQERFVYRHRWRAGDLLLWDNRMTLHRATDFDRRHRRLMQRVSAGGEIPS
jgi:taurine dioxygenase